MKVRVAYPFSIDRFSETRVCCTGSTLPAHRLGEIPKEGRIRICVPYTSKRTLNRIAQCLWYAEGISLDGFTSEEVLREKASSEEVLREKATLAMMHRKIIKGRVLRNKGGTSLDEGKSRVSI